MTNVTRLHIVRPGDRVKKGDVIAVTGRTGLMAHLPPHVHVERMKFFGGGDEDYVTLSIDWERQDLLFNEYLVTYKKWRRWERKMHGLYKRC